MPYKCVHYPLRELTNYTPPITQLSAWIRDDGDATLAKFAKVPLDCGSRIKEHEQEFEKFFFVSKVSASKINLFMIELNPLNCSRVETHCQGPGSAGGFR